MSASTFTLVPDGQYVFGRQSARLSPNQCQAPATGLEAVTFMCFSTVARAFAATGFVKTTEIGMATPTVVPVCGVIVSSSIGGPAGLVGLGEALALGLPDAFPSSPLALSLPPPPQALAPTSMAPVTSAIPMLPLRRPTTCPVLSRFGPDGPDSLSDGSGAGCSCMRCVKRVSKLGVGPRRRPLGRHRERPVTTGMGLVRFAAPLTVPTAHALGGLGLGAPG